MSDYQRTVTSQAELDKALADKVRAIDIRSPEGVWLELRDSGSATVHAWDSATVSAWGSATVSAWDSATVSASGSATVSAWGSATVSASGSATVHAWGSATVHAWGSATVHATPYVAVHLHSSTVVTEGGVIIDHTKVDQTDAKSWCEYHGVTVENGIAFVYKAVTDDWKSGYGWDYSPGSTPACEDFRDTDECGNGLHFGPTPVHALTYHESATRFVVCGVKLSELRPITGGGAAKCKAPRVTVPCVEVDVHGRVVEQAVSA